MSCCAARSALGLTASRPSFRAPTAESALVRRAAVARDERHQPAARQDERRRLPHHQLAACVSRPLDLRELIARLVETFLTLPAPSPPASPSPSVDGARSDDKVHGWGPSKNGYVYQKAYLEFFVSAAQLDRLVGRIERDTHITYYAVNRQGDLRTNTQSEGPNAVTWGVFPGKEIIQPTIVEAVSFIAWKDEAFAIGAQWAKLYPEGSKSRALIDGIMDSYYLVNVRLLALRLLPSLRAARTDALALLSPRPLGRSQLVQGEGGHLCAVRGPRRQDARQRQALVRAPVFAPACRPILLSLFALPSPRPTIRSLARTHHHPALDFSHLHAHPSLDHPTLTAQGAHPPAANALTTPHPPPVPPVSHPRTQRAGPPVPSSTMLYPPASFHSGPHPPPTKTALARDPSPFIRSALLDFLPPRPVWRLTRVPTRAAPSRPARSVHLLDGCPPAHRQTTSVTTTIREGSAC